MKKVLLIVVSTLLLAACTPAVKNEGADSTALDTAKLVSDTVEVSGGASAPAENVK